MPRDSSDKPASSAPRSAIHPNVVLAICCMSLLLTGMDVTIVNVALPSIGKNLHASLSGMQWVIDAYTLVVATLLMLTGSLSDRFGRRRTFQIGLATFSAGSLLCSVAHGIGQLVLFRAVQGVGASMLNPVALSIIANVFPKPADRARAVGIWGAVAGLSMALGPLLGGALTQTVGWRAIFWINLPIALVVIALAAKYVPESRAPHARAFDPVGQTLVAVGLGTLTYAIIDGPHGGWHSAEIVGLFAVAAASLAGFLLYEPRRREPLLDLRFFRSVPFATAAILAVVSFGGYSAFLFLNALYLQGERGLSALHTGLTTLPLALGMSVSAPLSGRMVARFGARPSLLLSGCAFVLSALGLVRLGDATTIVWLLLVYLLFGVGLGMVNPAISNSAVAGMPLSQAGVAAAIASTGRQVGAALGVAIAGTIVAASRKHGIRFSQATHPVWWALVAAGVVVFVAGWISSTAWAQASTGRVAALFVDPGRQPAG